MNTLKFRGKSSLGEWYYGGITENKNYIVKQFVFQNVRPETVGQFTGHCDIDGKEIYEGDIILINHLPYIVRWREAESRFIAWSNLLHMSIRIDCKVVGNIHDNPNYFDELQNKILNNRG